MSAWMRIGICDYFPALNLIFRLHLKPSHLNPVQAAALPLAGLTAYHALFVCAGFKHTHKVIPYLRLIFI
jgi:hypothetical protein